MHPVLKVTGVGHIWYYIPLCTIFAQKSNADLFRTQFHVSKSRSQNTAPILKEDFLTHQSGNQKTIQESQPPIPAGVGLEISFRSIPRAFSEVIHNFNQFSRHQVFQYSLDNSIGPYRRQSINLYVLGPIGPIQIPLWEFNHTVVTGALGQKYKSGLALSNQGTHLEDSKG
ncbi:hypothetical protein O181_133531 [Austropuccinia psidii MF-1]|uniref:Uncharacterized protein n=1 Tax=Austropuccinia psidii MF-1 TaxID=1389203 RepID=A0A9Q3L816_9BASI|nr:hypothetical protein [Austropuccinia psidii MF-1]